MPFDEEELDPHGECKAEIDRLLAALRDIDACYVDKFGGQIQGLKDGVPLHRPCEIARAALNAS